MSKNQFLFPSATNLKLSIVGLACYLVVTQMYAAPPQLTYPGNTLRDGTLALANQHEFAVKQDPDSAANHVGICEAYAMHWCFGFAPRDEVLPKMKVAANRAVALAPKNAAARTALGIVKLSEWDWAGADTELATAVKLDPNRSQSRHWYALYLAAMGRHQEALVQSERAVSLDDSPGMQTGLGAILYFGRDWQRMVKELRSTVQDHPEFAYAYDWLGMAYVQEIRFAESIETYEKASELSEGLVEIVAGLGHAYALAGKQTQARDILKHLLALDERWYVPPVQIAYVHVGLGENEQAIRLLERAYREHSWELVFLREEPWFDPIRGDPRFAKLLANMHFSDQSVE